MAPVIAPLGDSALAVTLAEGAAPATSALAARFAARVRRRMLPGVRDVVSAYGTVTVYFDPRSADPDGIEPVLRALLGAPETDDTHDPRGRLHVIPVRYAGPDLAEVAERTGLSQREVVRRHASPTYEVCFLGFVPGFAYLGPLDPALVLPRRAEPRRRVPAGSVAVAGAQTGIYPFETPGGWHLIGHTDVMLFDPTSDPPNLLAAGDRIRFEPLDA
ncbi:MAG TPA: 5-oxoprolinase subunit PxpB [Gemmatimonadales bacterium]|nr:5-oxoprolinase subunit PxpB [Gemmatimonadales bacterium]